MEPIHFKVDVKREGSVLVVAPVGELDMATVGSLRTAIDQSRSDARCLVLDLRGLAFVDTSGLQLVFQERKRAAAEGGRFVLVRGGPHVHKVFEITGLIDELDFVDEPSDVLDDETHV